MIYRQGEFPMLFKYETAVRIVIAASVMFVSPMAIADGNNNSSGWKYEDFQKCKADGNTKEECNHMASLANGKDNDKCEDAAKKFSDAIGEFEGSCPKVGLRGNAGECAKAGRRA